MGAASSRRRRTSCIIRGVIPPRQQLLQLARLIGVDAFTKRFGPPHAAEPDERALRGLIGERLDQIARRLIEEAAASDDVIDAASAGVYLDDRLLTLADLLAPDQVERVRAIFQEQIAHW